MLVEPDGTIAALSGDRLYRVDPADPANPQGSRFPATPASGAFDRDPGGGYVVLAARAVGGGFAEDLVQVDMATGAITPILADLDTATGNTTVPHGPLAVAPDGSVYPRRWTGASSSASIARRRLRWSRACPPGHGPEPRHARRVPDMSLRDLASPGRPHRSPPRTSASPRARPPIR